MTVAAPTSLREARSQLVADATLQGLDFCRAYSDAADAWLASLLSEATGGQSSRVALIAVGGYGRGELCPGSDLDVAFVHHPRLRNVKKIADAVWYPVWDEGVHLDHSVRTPKQVLALAQDDLKVMLGFLDARLIAGDEGLAEEIIERTRAQWRSGLRTMIPRLAESVQQRHASRGDVAFLLEPDVKEDRGGLRDLHAIHSVASAMPEVTEPSSDPEIDRANAVLLAVRVELHRRSGKESDRLLLQEQDPVAAALGYPDADALMAAVATAGRRVAWASDDCWRRVIRRSADRTGSRSHEDQEIERGIVLRDGEIHLDGDVEPARDYSLVFRCASAAAEEGVPMSRSCLKILAENAAQPPDPWPSETRQALVRLLGSGRAAIREIETLQHYELFSRMIPEWSRVRNLPQRNALHKFTVDRHLCEAAANACAFVREVSRPDLLLIGTLLHDIGKGYPGDHTDAGMQIVGEIARRMGFGPSEVAILVSLVENHLLLPDTAAKRDLDDPATIDLVVHRAPSEEILLLLSALTQADSIATGPSVSSPWKMRMVRELVTRSLNRLAGLPATPEESAPEPDPKLETMITEAQLSGRPVIRHEPLPDNDGWDLSVTGPDKPGLLSVLAGVLALHGLTVRSAQVDAPTPGIAADRFSVGQMFDREPRWEELRSDLERALEGSGDLDSRLRAKVADYAGMKRPGAVLPAEPRVIVDNDASERATVVEVRASDGIGVLYKITAAIQECGLDIVTAKVHTLGHEVVDTFYVRRMVDGVASKVTHPAELSQIESRVMEMICDDSSNMKGDL